MRRSAAARLRRHAHAYVCVAAQACGVKHCHPVRSAFGGIGGGGGAGGRRADGRSRGGDSDIGDDRSAHGGWRCGGNIGARGGVAGDDEDAGGVDGGSAGKGEKR